MTAPPDDDDAGFSPFARTTAAPSPTDKGGGPTPTAAAAPPHDQRGGTSSRLSDLDDVNAMAAEAGDDLAPLPDVAAASGGAGLAYSKGPASASAGCTTLPPGAGSDDGNSAFCSAGGAASKPSRPKRKLIPLKQVVRHSYEYHGLNDLFFFCITALAVTMVLYWHWGETTATFKATVQRSFQQYGNPDWQSQSLINVDTMYDAVEYSVGWLEFWMQRADNIDWSNETVRVGEFGDLKYVRMLVNIDRNCDRALSPNMECYERDDLTDALRGGAFGGNKSYRNLLEWAGWQNVGRLRGRDSADAGSVKANQWWAYAIIAPKFNGVEAKRDNFTGRMYNVTRNTNLNYDNCDWAASNCSEAFPDGPKCAQRGTPVPFNNWWSSPDMCSSNTTKDTYFPRAVQRGKRFFVRHPNATQGGDDKGISAVLDLKPFLSKYAYSIAIDVLATNAVHNAQQGQASDTDRALFTMTMQRSAQAKDRPDRILWQITSTVPVRNSFYSQYTDRVRVAFEVTLFICLLGIIAFQVRQVYLCYMQHNSFKPWVSHFWNCFEALSNLTLLAWVIFYWVLYSLLRQQRWQYDDWDLMGLLAHRQLDDIMGWSSSYSAWLYMGIVVDLFFCLRLARYMRIHVGLKAFYQVFLIAAREFLDFAVFLFYILVLLGSAVFAFFQLTGGNYQFLRFPDGLSLMTRLTFGFLSYDEFQSQALGVGAAVSAVTLLFWLAVLLLVVYTQNIILAIVAEAYEEAKAKLGTAETSFLMLVLMRILFTVLFIVYRIRMFIKDVWYACTGWTGNSSARLPSMHKSSSSLGHSSNKGFLTPQGSGGSGKGSGGEAAAAAGGAYHTGGSNSLQHSGRGNGHMASSQQGAALSGQWGGELADEEDFIPLAPTTSRAVLPLDVEQGLAASSRVNLLGSGRTSSQFAPRLGDADALVFDDDDERPDAIASTAADTKSAVPPHHRQQQRLQSGRGGASSSASRTLSGSASRGYRQDDQTPAWGKKGGSLMQRLSSVWHDIILGETHILRMYRDLAPGTKEDVWVRSWKEKYWRPWCVARTAPLRQLVNLYQDFASYKLKEECTWLTNTQAKAVIAERWRGQSSGSSGSSSNLKDCDAVGAAPGGTISGHDSADNNLALLTFPGLLNETWVTEDELARLFAVSSQMSSVVRIWHSPFHPLTRNEVSYLVKAISVVYGVDEDMVMHPGQHHGGDAGAGVHGMAPGDGGPCQLSGAMPSTVSSQMRDVQLGQQNARKGGGGFFNSLNHKRRDGAAEHTRQLTWLLHANKRLEEATIRNAGQMQYANNRLERYVNMQEDFQRKQQRTNSQLLRGVETLTALVQAQQQVGQVGSPHAPGVAAMATGHWDSSSNNLSAQAGSAGAAGFMGGGGSSSSSLGPLSAVRRLNNIAQTATNKVLGGSRTGRTKSSASAASSSAEGAVLLARNASDLSSPASPTSPSAAAAAAAAAAGDAPAGEGHGQEGLLHEQAAVAACIDQGQQVATAATTGGGGAAATGLHAGSDSFVQSLQDQLQQQHRALQQQQELLQQLLARLPPPPPL